MSIAVTPFSVSVVADIVIVVLVFISSITCGCFSLKCLYIAAYLENAVFFSGTISALHILHVYVSPVFVTCSLSSICAIFTQFTLAIRAHPCYTMYKEVISL